MLEPGSKVFPRAHAFNTATDAEENTMIVKPTCSFNIV